MLSVLGGAVLVSFLGGGNFNLKAMLFIIELALILFQGDF